MVKPQDRKKRCYMGTKGILPMSQYNKISSSQSLDPDQFDSARLYND